MIMTEGEETDIEPAVLEINEIYKNYRRKEVLQGVSLQIEPGNCVGIVGGNGSGKTTLLSILAGALKADSGSLIFGGTDVTRDRSFYSARVAYVPQENPIIEELTVKDNLRLWYKGRIKEPFTMLGLQEVFQMPAGKLSGGMKKRLSIACALSNQAPILILDEPGAALDLACKADIQEYLKEYRDSGGIVILTSHEMEELVLCDQMYVLKQGKAEKIKTGLSAKELIASWI